MILDGGLCDVRDDTAGRPLVPRTPQDEVGVGSIPCPRCGGLLRAVVGWRARCPWCGTEYEPGRR